MHRIFITLKPMKILCFILATSEPTSSVNTGAVIGGTIPAFIALMALVIFLLYKKRKRREFYIRYIYVYICYTVYIFEKDTEMQ